MMAIRWQEIATLIAVLFALYFKRRAVKEWLHQKFCKFAKRRCHGK